MKEKGLNLVVNLDKMKGITSQEAVTKVKRTLGVKKAGHAGTLDPIATGILLVCLGEATKITRFLADLDKEYIALVKLGERTDTLDATGTVIRRADRVEVGRDEIEKILGRFTGTVRQTPPMFSAIKMAGKPLYKLARKGIEIERSERVVMIHRIEIAGFAPPWLEIKVSCSKGTYIRTLCDDIGEALGVGGHVAELRRTRIGGFHIDDSVTLEALAQSTMGRQSAGEGEEPHHRGVSAIDHALQHLEEITLTAEAFLRARNGLPFRPETPLNPDSFVRLKDPSGWLFGVGRASGDSVRIERILHI